MIYILIKEAKNKSSDLGAENMNELNQTSVSGDTFLIKFLFLI